MASSFRKTLAVLLFAFSANSSFAHFSMLLPDKASIKKGETVTLTYQWGHPFEHQLFDALAPSSVHFNSRLGPQPPIGNLEEGFVTDGTKKVRVFRWSYTPDERRDYVFLIETQPIWMEEEGTFFQDSVKVVVHVQAQRDWDHAFGRKFEIVPLTRPYGLQPGMILQARALKDEKPLAGALVEIERYNPVPPKELPPDEQITHTAKTDPNGIVTCTLTEPGWWCVAAHCNGGTAKRDGKEVPVRKRAILWVFVDEKPPTQSGK
jgi:cobalt/nickel transport protein